MTSIAKNQKGKTTKINDKGTNGKRQTKGYNKYTNYRKVKQI